MSAASVLARAQAAALALMVDTCTIRRLASTSTDSETGVITPTYTTVYSGACKVQARQPQSNARPHDLGEAAILVAHLELHLPMTATGVASDDLVNITASAHDPELLARSWHITSLAHKSFLSARRFSMTEVTS
jgi:hypothetical protein